MELYLSLGTNLGNRLENLKTAIGWTTISFGSPVKRMSSIFQSQAWGFDGRPFLNAIIVLDVPDTMSPQSMLFICKQVEKTMGRTDDEEYDKNGQRIYHDRIIDVDILFAGLRRVSLKDELEIPHPGIKSRSFVTLPLREVVDSELKKAFPEIFD